LPGIEARRWRESRWDEAHAGNESAIESVGHRDGLDPRCAEDFERRVRAAADRDSSSLQYLDARIKQRGIQAAQIRRRRNPGEARRFKTVCAMPVFHRDHVKVRADFIFGIEHLRQLAGSHGVSHRHRKITGER